MMNELIGTYRTNQIMYFDFYTCYWDKYKPESGKYKEDYDLMKTGTILKAFEVLEDDICFEGEIMTIECTNGKHTIYFRNLDDLYECDWLDEIKE